MLQILYVTSLGFSRASLLLQLIRLAPTPQMRRVFWGLFAFSVSFALSSFLTHVFICLGHPSLFWLSKEPSKDVKEGRCLNYPKLQIVVGLWKRYDGDTWKSTHETGLSRLLESILQ